MILKGKIWKLKDNIDTDLIYPGKYLPIIDSKEMAKHALEGLDREFPKKIQKGDIIVCGKNFGCGSSREQAATALKSAGIACVVAKSFSRIFFRNAINQGLALVQSERAYDFAEDGKEITIDFEKGEITLNEKKIDFSPLPDFIKEILESGGLVPYIKEKLKQK